MILALDLGLRRIGIARSRSGLLAEPVATHELRHGSLSTKAGLAELIEVIRTLCHDEPLSRLIVGLPMLANGEESTFAKELKSYAELIAHALAVPLDYEDETLTTASSQTDAEAACLILEQYLTAHEQTAA